MPEEFRIGRYKLGRRPNSPNWCRVWYDAATRQGRYESLGTGDHEEAKRRLAEWVTLNVTQRNVAPQDMRLSEVFLKYWHNHGQHLASSANAKAAIRHALEIVDGDPNVSEFDALAQQRVIDELMRRYPGKGTAKRYFASIKAAILWARGMRIITDCPPFARTPPDGDPQERIMSVEELARLWDAADQHYMRAFLMVMMTTLARAGPARMLTKEQCNLDRGLVDLHPKGARRTAKRNPVVPLPMALRPWIEASAFHLVERNGKPLADHRKPFKELRDVAGFGKDVTAKVIRRTMATEMMERGVPDPIISHYMGHQVTAVWTTGQYLKFRPDYLEAGRAAIDSVLREMARSANRAIMPFETDVRTSSVLHINPKGR